MESAPRLTCQQCQTRKRRCDKGSPCSPCKFAGLSCEPVQRARLPRRKSARASKQNASLDTHVAHIESLLKLQDEAYKPAPNSIDHERPVNATSPDISESIAPEFWSALSEAVHGLRKSLETPEDEEEEVSAMAEHVQWGPTSTQHIGSILFPLSLPGRGRMLPSPMKKVRAELLQLYRYRVDSVYKLLHWPTVLSMLSVSQGRSPDTAPSVSVQALEYSIYFMALCSITNKDAEEMELGYRLDMLYLYRSAVEDLLSKSCLLQSPDLTVLQAFAIYLIALRTCLSGGQTWTLVAVAVRAATALRLGEELEGEFTPFYMQVRRRLYFAIAIIDNYSALDRGTKPILPSSALCTPPLDINDCDMSPSNDVPMVPSSEPTDMAHTTIIYDAMICQRKLYELSQLPQDERNHWQKKLDVIAKFEEAVSHRNSKIGERVGPLERLQIISAKQITVSIQLLLQRAPYRQHHPAVPPGNEYNVMEAAIEVLQQRLQATSPELRPWAWKNWVQWHALAVLLVELTVQSHVSISDTAYKVATKGFRRYARLVADSQAGLLWKPIARLMRQVQRMKQKSLTCDIHDGSAAMPEGEEKATNQLDQVNPNDVDIIDFSKWNIDDVSTNSCSNNGVQSHDHNSSETSIDEKSLLAWDAFLRDIEISTT